MKHIKLYEQFVNEAKWDTSTGITSSDSLLMGACHTGNEIGKYEDQKVYALFLDKNTVEPMFRSSLQQTIVSDANAYPTEKLIDAAMHLASQPYGVHVKEKAISSGKLYVKFNSTEYTYEFKGGKWMGSKTSRGKVQEVPMSLYEFMSALVACKFKEVGKKEVGSK